MDLQTKNKPLKLLSTQRNAIDRISLFEIQIWTIDDLASVLNISKGSIYNKVSKDEIPFHKKGKRGRLYFIPSEILEWIKEGEFR